MVSYKIKYLAMKLKYINAKNKLKGGTSGISIDLPKPEEPRLHSHIHQHGNKNDDKQHSHGHWHAKDPTINYNNEASLREHIEQGSHKHIAESYFDAQGKKKTKAHPENNSQPSASPSASPRNMSKVSSDIDAAKQALMSIGLNRIEAEIALENSNGELNMALSNLVSNKTITPSQRCAILQGQPQQQGNVTSVALQDMYQDMYQQIQQQPQQLEDKPNIVESLFEPEYQLVNPELKELNIDEDKARGKNVNCIDYHKDKDSCLAIPNCTYTKNNYCKTRKNVKQGTKEFQGPIGKYI